ncbi:hypothetical protein BRADI_1g18745v3, partial [Brachypodium distachyon]
RGASAAKKFHLVCRRDITEYDPKREDFIYTRFCSFNLAFFDLNEESTAMHGPPLEELLMSEMHLMPSSSVNIISLKIIESDVGYPVDVFGTVIARDEVDYKCVYLFRRGRNDSQRICSPEDMLTLTVPRRGFGVTDTMIFEINLKIRGDTSVDDKDFSKGVIEHCSVQHFTSMRPVAHLLTSWRSTVELLCSQVAWPVGATIKVNIMNGPCDVPFNGKISAWTVGNVHHHIILYEYNGRTGTCSPALIEHDGSIVLARSFVAVPVPSLDNMHHLQEDEEEEEDIVLYVCFISGSNEDERTIVTLRFPEEETVCNNGYYELRVKVSWTTIYYNIY